MGPGLDMREKGMTVGPTLAGAVAGLNEVTVVPTSVADATFVIVLAMPLPLPSPTRVP